MTVKNCCVGVRKSSRQPDRQMDRTPTGAELIGSGRAIADCSGAAGRHLRPDRLPSTVDVFDWSIRGLPKLWHACRKWHAERSPWHAAFTAVPIFIISFALPPSLYCEEHLCIYTYLTVYELQLLPSNTAGKHLYTNRSGAKC